MPNDAEHTRLDNSKIANKPLTNTTAETYEHRILTLPTARRVRHCHYQAVEQTARFMLNVDDSNDIIKIQRQNMHAMRQTI